MPRRMISPVERARKSSSCWGASYSASWARKTRTSQEIIPPGAISRPTPGRNERSNSVANQSAGEKSAYQQSQCRKLHEMDPLDASSSRAGQARFVTKAKWHSAVGLELGGRAATTGASVIEPPIPDNYQCRDHQYGNNLFRVHRLHSHA